MERTKEIERDKFRSDLIKNTIEGAFENPLSDSTESEWQGAIWGMQLAQYRSAITDTAISNAMQKLTKFTASMQRSLLEVAYSMYKGVFNNEIDPVLNEITNAKLFAMSVEYLMLSENKESIIQYQELMKSIFKHWETDPILLMLNYRIDVKNGDVSSALPPIEDLLNQPFNPNYITLYSFYRKNRDYIGLTIFRKKDGTFLRDKMYNLVTVPQFARSVTNLPSYLTNGNTPQGIYSFKSLYISKNVFIGPTNAVRTRMPFEVSLQEFIHGNNSNDEWSLTHYENLLPESWRNYFPIYESYYAGEAGRTDIVAHGTTIDPEFYKQDIFHPYTPSLGCVTTKELWSEETGERIESDQQKLIDIIKSLNTTYGYWVIVELDDKESNVTTEEIEKFFE